MAQGAAAGKQERTCYLEGAAMRSEVEQLRDELSPHSTRSSGMCSSSAVARRYLGANLWSTSLPLIFQKKSSSFFFEFRPRMHVNEFRSLSGAELAAAQETTFQAFLSDDSIDVGLGSLKRVHLIAALHLVRLHANCRGLKVWHPALDMFVLPDAVDTLSRKHVMRIAACALMAWGVLTDKVADYGEHLVTLTLVRFGYDTNDPSIHALPLMRDWFDAIERHRLARDDSIRLYDAWVEQLRDELKASVELSHKAASCAMKGEAAEMLSGARNRLRRAEERTDDWLVDWLLVSFATTLPYTHRFNAFQVVVLGTLHPREAVATARVGRKRLRVDD